MTFVVESGSGTPGANAYTAVAFVTQYLTERGRATENGWTASSNDEKQQAIVKGTDYVEQRISGRVRGSKANTLIAGRQASALLELTVLPIDGELFTVGVRVYRMSDMLEDEGDVLIGADIPTTIANMVAAVNQEPAQIGAAFEEHTQYNYDAFAIDQAPQLVIGARTEGENGNLITFTTDIASSTITGGGTLIDGLDEAEQQLSFPRIGLYTDDGTAIVGVPVKVKRATAEYAVRSMAAPLSPDPAWDDRFGAVKAFRTKVGPIEEETQYTDGGPIGTVKPYPAADALLEEFLEAGGGVIRA